MNLKRILILASVLFLFSFFVPQTSIAVDASEASTYKYPIITRIGEGIKYFFTFKTENKVQVLDQYAEKRLTWAQEYTNVGDDTNAENMIQSYLKIKERQNNLLGKIDGEVLGAVAERTVEQQKTMETIKTKAGDNLKMEVVQVQERVVNQVAERIVVVNGTEGQTEFFNKVEHVWAPGTGPGGESGVVIEGGTMQFAPGTSAGGPSGADIKTVEVKTGGTTNNVVETGDGGLAPGTTMGGSGGNTIDPGAVDKNGPDGSSTWLAP